VTVDFESESLTVLLKRVNSEESLLAFIAALAKDRREAVVAERENPSSAYGPENTSMEAFLEAAAAWAESTNFGLTQGLLPIIPGSDLRFSSMRKKSTNEGRSFSKPAR